MSKRILPIALLFAAVPLIPTDGKPPDPRPAEPALAAVPTDAFYFASVKLSKIWDHASAKPLRDWDRGL